MKYYKNLIWFCTVAFVCIFSIHFTGYAAFAAEKASNWRPTYDLILRYINFGIIVFVIFKYGKSPIMNFLKGRKEKLALEIKELEDAKQDAIQKINETRQIIDDSESRFAKLKERIVSQGERKKAEIIESSQRQSKMMIEDAKRRVDSHFLHAKDQFKAELIDTAIDLATTKLPGEITDKDNDQLINDYLAGAATK